MEIKQWFRNKIAALSIALSNVEKNFLSQKSSEDTDELKKEQRHLQVCIKCTHRNNDIYKAL